MIDSRTSAGDTNSAGRVAARVTVVFAAAGIASACRGVPDWSVSAPLGLSYALLVAHTYRSLCCFGAIIPRGLRGQRMIDGVLAASYLALAASLGDTVRFALFGALLFAVATLKYAVLVGRLGASDLLARKVRVDTYGTIAAVLAAMVASGGHAWAAGWALLGVNLVANVYLLWWNPLYRE